MIKFKPFVVGSLVSIGSLGLQPAFAANNVQAENEKLRQELTVLKNLLQQQQSQQQLMAEKIAKIENQAQTQNQVKVPVLAQGISQLKSGAEVQVYGNVRMDTSYQVDGSAASRMYNNINQVPLEGMDGGKDRFKSTLSATRLGMDIRSQHNDKNVAAKIEVDFLGGADLDNLRIRHAYINYDKWLFGQTWSNFAIPDYMPETIDALGYVGGAVKRTPQVRYQQSLNKQSQVLVALEDSKDKLNIKNLPALTARLNWNMNEQINMSLRAMTAGKSAENDSFWAWGTGLGIQYQPLSNTTFKLDYYHIVGDSSFISWTNPGFSSNAAGDILGKNKFDSISLGVTQKFNDQWRATLGYGYMKAHLDQDYLSGIKNKDGTVDTSTINKELWQIWGNVFYRPVKSVSLGLEYVYGERTSEGVVIKSDKTLSGDKGTDNRISAVAIYHF